MADETGKSSSSFGPGDGVQQFVGSTFDVSFAAGKLLNGESTTAIEALDAGANAIGGTLLVGGIVIGVASDGLDGGIKSAVTGLFAVEGAEVGGAAGLALGGPVGAIIGTVVGGFGANEPAPEICTGR
jgi:hypothetical protein